MDKKIYKLRALVIAVSFLVGGQLYASLYEWDSKSKARKLEKILTEAPIISVKGLKQYFKEKRKIQEASWSSNALKIVELEGGIKAVFKKGEYGHGEVAAYKASQAMKLGLVPPTVLRSINGEFGSLQLFVPSIGTIETYKKKLSSKLLSDMQIFYFIFGQWDTHKGNQLVYKQNGEMKLALIDNAGILHRQQVIYGKFPFVEKGEDKVNKSSSSEPAEFPFSDARPLEFKSYTAFTDFMIPFIKKDQIRQLWKGKDPIPYIIWHNSLWTQIYKHSKKKPVFTSVYYTSTLEEAQRLDYVRLRKVWSHAYALEPSYYEDLVNLTLQRRDQLIKHALSTGTIK